MMFAFALVPLLVLGGGAIDFTQAERVKDELQTATDTAALAVARDGLGITNQADLNTLAKTYVAANFHSQSSYSVDSVTLDRATVTANVSTSAPVTTTFLKLVGLNTLQVKAHSQTKGLGFEISMVLDTSGSMTEAAGSGGSKIDALKAAASSLFDTLFADSTVSNRFSISVVPFAANVNVGASNATASWMTGKERTNAYGSDYKSTVDLFKMFSSSAGYLKNVSWGGCVMSRPAPYDTDDTTPGSGDTLFTPWFAPDEPDTTPYGAYVNNYLSDSGGNCTSGDLSANDDRSRLQRVCKYKGATANTSANSGNNSQHGPNYLCDTTPITPLTNSRSTLDKAITALHAEGNTNITEGLMWGWRTLSPTAPFTEGKPYATPNNRKVIILMTDGVNTNGGFGGTSIFTTGSLYSSFGYAYHQNLGTNMNDSALTAAMNTKTATACTNAKAKGITIYSIAFGPEAAASKPLLSACASSPDYFYAPQNSSDLKPVFIAIAESINALRIAQ